MCVYVCRDRFPAIDFEDDSDNAVAVAVAAAAVEENNEYVDEYEDDDEDGDEDEDEDDDESDDEDDENDDSDDSLKKSSVLCRFFLHSTCLKGSSCEFSHDVSHAKLDNVCRFERKIFDTCPNTVRVCIYILLPLSHQFSLMLLFSGTFFVAIVSMGIAVTLFI